MKTCCVHNPLGFCSNCKDLKPYTVFRYNPDCNKSGEEDKCCGYFWGMSGDKVKPMEQSKTPIKETTRNIGRKVLFQFLSQLPVYEGTIISETMTMGGANATSLFYSARRRLNKDELAVVGSLAKSKYMELPLSLRFGSPIIPKGETETHHDHFIDDADILSFVETDEVGEPYYVVNI